MVRKEVWLAAVDEVKPNTFGTEWDIFLAIARKHSIGFIPEPLVTYRRAGTGISQQNWKRVGHDITGLERIYRKGLWEGVVSHSEMLRLWANAAQYGSIYWRGRGEPARARWFIVQGLKKSPLSLPLWVEGAKALVGKSRLDAGSKSQLP
jgi:hypothetical protein